MRNVVNTLPATLPPPSPRIWAHHIRGRYWSAKIDDISLRPPAFNTLWSRLSKNKI